MTLIYPCPLDDRAEFRKFAERYVTTFLRFPPGAEHRFMPVFCCGEPTDEDRALFEPLKPAGFLRYDGGGLDIGCAQSVAGELQGEDFMVASTSRVYFHREGWLRRIHEARLKYGNGLYGAAGSYEGWEFKPAPNPHMRTVLYGMPPKIFGELPKVIDRATAHKFEAGEWNYANYCVRKGLPVKMVTWDGEYDKKQWRLPPNIFRRGNQLNMLCFDKHTDVYAAADEREKRRLEAVSDGTLP